MGGGYMWIPCLVIFWHNIQVKPRSLFLRHSSQSKSFGPKNNLVRGRCPACEILMPSVQFPVGDHTPCCYIPIANNIMWRVTSVRIVCIPPTVADGQPRGGGRSPRVYSRQRQSPGSFGRGRRQRQRGGRDASPDQGTQQYELFHVSDRTAFGHLRGLACVDAGVSHAHVPALVTILQQC